MALASAHLPARAQCPRPQARRRTGNVVRATAAPPAASPDVAQASRDAASATMAEKEDWQSGVRSVQGRRKHRLWEPALDPPPLLQDVCVVLVSPKRPVSVGTVARALGCFECEDLRIIQPRCDHLMRSGRNASKGAQYILWRAQQCDSIEAALADVDVSIACTRWVAGRPNACRSMAELLAVPELAALLQGSSDVASSSNSSSSNGSSSNDSSSKDAAAAAESQPPVPQRRRKVALVFGREEAGLLPAEVDACDYTLSIPIGRLQESMSLSHAVSVVLSHLFERRSLAGGYALPQGLGDLAQGFEDVGVER